MKLAHSGVGLLTLLCLTATVVNAGILGLTPESPFYFMEQSYDNIHYDFLTFNSEQKAYVKLEQANERLIEAKQVAASNSMMAVDLITEYKNTIAEGEEQIQSLPEPAQAVYHRSLETEMDNHRRTLNEIKILVQDGSKNLVNDLTTEIQATKQTIQIERSVQENSRTEAISILDARWASVTYCDKDLEIDKDINEVVRFGLLDNSGSMIWQKTIKVQNSHVTCEVSDAPTTTISITLDYYRNLLQTYFRTTPSDAINAYREGSIKISPDTKIIEYGMYLQ